MPPKATTKAPDQPNALPAHEGPQAPAAVQAEPERKVQQLNPSRMEGAEYQRNVWVMTAHENTTPSDLTDRAYWAHVAGKLKPWDRIEARANDGTWYAEFLVLEAGRTWAKVHMLHCASLTSADVAMSQATAMMPYEVKFRGPHCKWSVIRKSDHEVVHEFEETQGSAIDWLNNRMKAGF